MARAQKDISKELDGALLEMAGDFRGTGLMSEATHEKITMRQMGTSEAAVAPLTGEDIRALREQARMSQAVFARYLNLTPGYVSQLERGTRSPTGPALVLLNVIRRHGMDMVLA